jgi:hypothetical protein
LIATKKTFSALTTLFVIQKFNRLRSILSERSRSAATVPRGASHRPQVTMAVGKLVPGLSILTLGLPQASQTNLKVGSWFMATPKILDAV